MIVKTYEGLAGTKNETMLKGGRAVTRRFLLEEDGVGFTLAKRISSRSKRPQRSRDRAIEIFRSQDRD